jgi:uncharacterized membrane protein
MDSSQTRTENRVWALVAYALAPLGSVPALLLPQARTAGAQDRPALKRHAKQALLAGILGAAASIVLGLIPALSCAAMPFAGIFWLYLIYCGVRAYQGRNVEIPVVCRFAG